MMRAHMNQPEQPGWYPDQQGMPNQRYWDGQEHPAWSRDWSAPSDFDAPTGPIPVPVVVRAEQPQEVGTSNVVPIIFAVSFLLAFLLAVGVIWISTASLT